MPAVGVEAEQIFNFGHAATIWPKTAAAVMKIEIGTSWAILYFFFLPHDQKMSILILRGCATVMQNNKDFFLINESVKII